MQGSCLFHTTVPELFRGNAATRDLVRAGVFRRLACALPNRSRRRGASRSVRIPSRSLTHFPPRLRSLYLRGFNLGDQSVSRTLRCAISKPGILPVATRLNQWHIVPV